MTKLLLIRHGHVEGIDPARFRGRTDLALTELGIAQARAVARRVSIQWAPAAVYTSPMKRCVTTGAMISELCGAPAAVLPTLNDLDYGQWHWKTHDEAKLEAPSLFERWFTAPQWVRFPGGESLQDVSVRVSDALRFAVERHRTECVVFVAHESVNRVLLLQLLDLPLSAYWRLVQGPCALNEIDISEDDVCVRRMNDTG
jgi:probable phosphoglycerate mutase